MKVGVEILTGSLSYIEVGDNATVGDLKKEIEAQLNLPVDRIVLMLRREEQNDHVMISEDDKASLVDCGVRDGSHIYLHFTPPPDGESPFGHLFTVHDSLLC